MQIDERRENHLKIFFCIQESDHNGSYLEINLTFSAIKPERIEIFQLKNIGYQKKFKRLAANTSDFTSCFNDDIPFVIQAANWIKCLKSWGWAVPSSG